MLPCAKQILKVINANNESANEVHNYTILIKLTWNAIEKYSAIKINYVFHWCAYN